MRFAEYSLKPLLRFSEHEKDSWTIDDAMKGVSIMGGTGSGKTSASGKSLAIKYLKEGWGGIVLCAKTEEADLWKNYCEEAGRSTDFIRFQKGGVYRDRPMVFNPLDYEMKRDGEGAGDTQNITNIFMNIYRLGSRISGEGDMKEERFWDTALKRCLNRTIDLIKLAGEDLTFRNMVNILASCDEVTGELLAAAVKLTILGKGEQFETDDHYCLRCMVKAYRNTQYEPRHSEKSNAHDLQMIYFTTSFRSLGEKVKPTVTESFMGLAEPFLSGILRNHFSGATTLRPELTYTEQKIIVLDFPIKEYLDAGVIGQSVFKLMFQQAIERRNTEKYPVPVFLWADEAQYFLNPYDQLFLTTARSSRTSTVYLSQNLSNYLAAMASHGHEHAKVHSLMGNLATKIFHANSDAETNEYASKLIGNDIQYLAQVGSQQGYVDFSYSNSEGLNSQYLPQVQPREFTTLKSGGGLNSYKVEAVIMVSGRKWADEKNFIKTTFTQKFLYDEK